MAAAEGRSILLEGAQATLLDVDHGTYPFVTSSSTTVGGAICGTGLAPNRLTGGWESCAPIQRESVRALFRRMMEGEAELGQMIRERGREYGASTGRPRRCGWFDAFATRFAGEINGFTSVALTKSDVLDTMKSKSAPVTSWMVELRIFAVSQDLRRIEPIYATLPGWKTSTVGTTEMTSFRQRPSLRRISFRTNRCRDRSRLNRPRALPDNHHLQLRPRNLVEGLAKVQSSKH